MSVRVDKWLQVVRIFKTRTQAGRACTLGRVRVNGVVAKPHRLLLLEDRVEVQLEGWNRILVVKELRDKPVPKAQARELFLDLSPPRPRLDLVDRILLAGPESREPGQGRPTKRNRRQIERLKGR